MTPSGANFFRSASIADISDELDGRGRAPAAQDDRCPRTSYLREKRLGRRRPRARTHGVHFLTRSLTALLLMASPNSRTSSLMRDAIAVQVCSSISSLLTNTA